MFKYIGREMQQRDNSKSSLVEGEHPVAPSNPKGSNTSNGPEATVVLGTPLPDVLMSTVAEGRI